MSADKTTKIETRLAHAGRSPHDNHGAINPPVYHASTILQPSLDAWEAVRKPSYDGYSYGRDGTPTTRAFETAVAEIYGADDAVARAPLLIGHIGQPPAKVGLDPGAEAFQFRLAAVLPERLRPKDFHGLSLPA